MSLLSRDFLLLLRDRRSVPQLPHLDSSSLGGAIGHGAGAGFMQEIDGPIPKSIFADWWTNDLWCASLCSLVAATGSAQNHRHRDRRPRCRTVTDSGSTGTGLWLPTMKPRSKLSKPIAGRSRLRSPRVGRRHANAILQEHIQSVPALHQETSAAQQALTSHSDRGFALDGTMRSSRHCSLTRQKEVYSWLAG